MAKFLTNLDLNLNEIQNAKIHILAAEPTGVAGRIYYNSTTKKVGYHNGEAWVYLTIPADIQEALESFQQSLANYIPISQKGAASGVATLDATGKVPTSQLPSYVDDVLEYADFDSLPEAGTSGVIYVTLDDNKTYRWGGSAYVEISASLALGETTGTAYDGGKGKALADKVAALEEGSVNRYTGVLAAGSTSTTVTHNFNSTDVLVQTYDKTTGESVLTEVTRAANSVTVSLARAYSNAIQVVVMK